MNDDILTICNIYKSICEATWNGSPKGMQISKLKKQYNLKKRDMMTLLNFLQKFIQFESSERFNFEIIRYPEALIKNSKIDEQICYEDYEVDIGEEDNDFENIKNSDYILIHDKVETIMEKLDSKDIDINNQTFIKRLLADSKNNWKEISNVLIEKHFIVDKTENELLAGRKRELKILWINAVLMQKSATITYKMSAQKTKSELIIPLGLYYTYFSDEYRCVYMTEDGEEDELDLSDILNISITDKKKERNFNLNEYLFKIRTENLILHVYNEGNVIKKFNKQLKGYDFQTEEFEDYIRYSIKTDNVWAYEKTIKSFGRSIIVKEPEYFSEHFKKETEEALEFYSQLKI